jgi:hypothetical protein
MPDEAEFKPPKPAVVYTTPLRLGWRNIILGTFIGILIIAILAGAYMVYNKYSDNPLPNNLFQKSASPSAKQSTPSAKKDETARWKTYESTIHYYKVNYPSNWSFSKEDVKETQSERAYLNFDSTKLTNQPSIRIFGNYPYPSGGWKTKYPNSVEEKVTLGSKNATKWTKTDEADEIYYLKFSSNFYLIFYVNYGGDKKLTDQVLSTFKVLD